MWEKRGWQSGGGAKEVRGRSTSSAAARESGEGTGGAWRLIDLAQDRGVRIAMQADAQPGAARQGYRSRTAAHYAQAAGAIDDLKKLPARLDAIAREKAVGIDTIEIWRREAYRPEEQDHPPLGEARHAPSAPRDQRTAPPTSGASAERG